MRQTGTEGKLPVNVNGGHDWTGDTGDSRSSGLLSGPAADEASSTRHEA